MTNKTLPEYRSFECQNN